MAAGGGRWLLDAARQRSIRGAMVARLHLFPTCLPPHKPDLASNKKDRVWLPQKRSCPRPPTPPTFLFTTAKKKTVSLSRRCNRCGPELFLTLGLGIDAVHPAEWCRLGCRRVSGAGFHPPTCLATLAVLLHRHPCKNGGIFHSTFLLPMYLMLKF